MGPMRGASLGVAGLFGALLVSGCALPPALVVASYSADIVSYAASGKTITDHAYSAVARSDCSFTRILRRKPICVDEPANTEIAQAETAATPADAAAPSAATPEIAPSLYVPIGSFADAANAERAMTRYAAYHPVNVAVRVHGRQFHRVVAGPLSPDEAAALREKMVAAMAKPAHG